MPGVNETGDPLNASLSFFMLLAAVTLALTFFAQLAEIFAALMLFMHSKGFTMTRSQ